MRKNRVLSFKYFLYDTIRILAAPGLLWFRPKRLYINQEAKKPIRGGALMISNHIGLFDPMYLMLSIWERRHHFLAMSDFFNKKFKKWIFIHAFLCIEVDRNNFSIMTFKEIVKHLKDGELVTMFPEGHVNVEEKGVQTFKSGMIAMALRSGCPIIPVYIKRRKHFYSRLVVGVGEAFDIQKFSNSDKVNMNDINKAAEYLHEQEVLLEQYVLEQTEKKKKC